MLSGERHMQKIEPKTLEVVTQITVDTIMHLFS